MLVALLEHRVMALAVFAPQAELGTQAVMLARRIEDFRCRCIERCQQLLQPGGFFGELGVVLGGVELGQRHGRASCRGFRSFAAKPTSGRTVGERPRTCTV